MHLLFSIGMNTILVSIIVAAIALTAMMFCVLKNDDLASLISRITLIMLFVGIVLCCVAKNDQTTPTSTTTTSGTKITVSASELAEFKKYEAAKAAEQTTVTMSQPELQDFKKFEASQKQN